MNTNSGAMTATTDPADACDTAMKMALAAAHNVEGRDRYFGQGSYDAALSRYKDAVEQKSEDAAIHVRMGESLKS